MLESKKINICHKIELVPNNKAKTHFRKAFGCARKAYNWGLAKWKEKYENGINTNIFEIKKEFNAIKKEEFPFMYEVSKYATQQPFIHLDRAFKKFFNDLKQGKVSYPKFKKKRYGSGSYYIGGDQVKIETKPSSTKSYLKVPKLGMVKMREALRFNGKINSVTISLEADKYYASFSVECDVSEYYRTHKSKGDKELALGIDVGLKNFVSLSIGLEVKSFQKLDRLEKKLIRLQRQLSKKQHPKTKDDVEKGVKKSKNYIKASIKLSKTYRKIRNIRNDFLQKLTSLLSRHARYFCIEDLNVKGMLKNHKLAKAISNVSFYEFRRQLEYKSGYLENTVIKADRFYPSSKLCSTCGNIKSELKLSEREYKCDVCGTTLDRDYNASLNLLNLIKEKIGKVLAEFTPADLTALQADFVKNRLVTSKV